MSDDEKDPKMSDDEKDPMDEEEERLTEMLMETCTPYGDEREDELAGSGVGLMNCGMLYLTRGELSICLEQKMNFIKSAALLAAAKFRFDLICDSTWSREVSASIAQLHSTILRNLWLEDKSHMISETIDNVKKMLHNLRQEQSTELAKIEMIDDTVSVKEEIVLQKKKIQKVKSLLAKTTTDYKFLMHYIANRCEGIIGAAPCKFALVGLGSLAKGEVTLHSEFNYVIVLEEDVQYRKDYDLVQEHFRWFAVVFQVIIIGLGETLVTSVGVEGLEEFTDIYTPSGIAIDGMMPLICELHTLRLVPPTSMISPFEFIKPVSEMIPLWSLCKFTDIGFALRSLLRNFCYVYGTREVFDEFSEAAYQTVFRHYTISVDGPVVASINMSEILRVSPFVDFGMPNMSADSCFYQPLSSCLAYIATVFRWKCHSGFEIISSMKNFSSDLGVVCGRKPKCHRLEFALATSCLARMRFFAISNGSRLKTFGLGIFNFIEDKSLRITIQQVWHLSRHLNGIRKYAVFGKVSDLKPSKISMDIGKNLESSLKDQLNILETNKNLIQVDKDYILHNCLHTVLRVLNINSKVRDIASLEVAKRYLLRHPGSIENQTAASLLLTIHLEQGHHQEVVRLAETHFTRCRFVDLANTLRLRKYHMNALLLSRPPDDVIQYCDKALEAFKDPASQLVFSFARIVSRADDAGKRRDITDLVDLTVQENAKYLKVKDVLFFLEEVFTYQYKYKWFEDAVLTIQVAYSMIESKVQVFAPFEFYRLVGGEPANCYMEILPNVKDTFRAVKMLTRVLEICKTANFREDCLSCFMEALLYLHDKYQQKPVKYVRRLIDQYIAVVPEHLKSLPFMKDVLQSYETKKAPSVVTKPQSDQSEPALLKSSIDEEPSQKSRTKESPSDLARSVSDTSEPGISTPPIEAEPSEKSKTKEISLTTGSNRINEISKPSIEEEPSEKYATKGKKMEPTQMYEGKGEIPISIKSDPSMSDLKTICKSSVRAIKKYGRYDEIFPKSATGNVKAPKSIKLKRSVEDLPQCEDAASKDHQTAMENPTYAKAIKSLDEKRVVENIVSHADAKSTHSAEDDSSKKNQEPAERFDVNETVLNAEYGNQHDLIQDELKKSIQPISERIKGENGSNLCQKNHKCDNETKLSKSEAKGSQTQQYDLKYSTSTKDSESPLSVGKVKSNSSNNLYENITTNDLTSNFKRLKSAGSVVKDSLACESNHKNPVCTKDGKLLRVEKVKSNNGTNVSEFVATNDKSHSASSPKRKAAPDAEFLHTGDGSFTTTDGKSQSASKCKPDSDTDIHLTTDGSFSRPQDANEMHSFRNLSKSTDSGNSSSDNVESTRQKTQSVVPRLVNASYGTMGSETDTCSSMSEDDVVPSSRNFKNTGAASSSGRSSPESVDDVTQAKSLCDARRSHSSSDDSQQIPKVASFKIEVKITRVGRRTNVHLVVRERKPQTPPDSGLKSDSGEER